MERIFGKDLRQHHTFVEEVRSASSCLSREGVVKTVASCVRSELSLSQGCLWFLHEGRVGHPPGVYSHGVEHQRRIIAHLYKHKIAHTDG